jgi:hypothetical protein
MNCDRARELLPLDLYGDLAASESNELHAHLKNCQECCKEQIALAGTRQALDSLPPPEVRVNTSRIEREATARQYRSQKRWKRSAIAMAALAAGLLLVLLVRPEIRIGGGQIVIRWSDPPRQPSEPVAVVKAPARDVDMEDRIRILSDLVRALREDVEAGDRDRKQQLDVLTTRLDLMRAQAQQRWNETCKDVTALYQAQFGKTD